MAEKMVEPGPRIPAIMHMRKKYGKHYGCLRRQIVATRKSGAKRREVQKARVEVARHARGMEDTMPYQSSVQRFKRAPWWRIGDPKNWPKQ